MTSITSADGIEMRVVISCIAGSGNAAAEVPAERMIKNFGPEAMFFVGVACGLRPYELGDVVTSDVVWAYEYAKTQSTGNLDRSRAKASPRHLTKDVEFFTAHAKWKSQFASILAGLPKAQLPRRTVDPTIHPSIWIASGEKVMGNGELVELNKVHDKIRAGEMEGYGFADACENQRPGVSWLVVRGISDYGDLTKDGKALAQQAANSSGNDTFIPNKDEYHAPAAVAAATFLRAFLETTYRRLEESSNSANSRRASTSGTLNDRQIEAMAGNGLLISEEFDRRQIKQACYELRVGSVYYELGDDKSRIDASAYGYVLLKPRQLTVVITKEVLNLPDDIVGRVLTKGRLFSVGILPVNTYADPGFNGNLGIVLFNVTDKYLRLSMGDAIAKIEFSRLAEPVVRPYSGQHGYQTRIWPIPEDVVMSDAQLQKDDRFRAKPSPSGGDTHRDDGLVGVRRLAAGAMIVGVAAIVIAIVAILSR